MWREHRGEAVVSGDGRPSSAAMLPDPIGVFTPVGCTLLTRMLYFRVCRRSPVAGYRLLDIGLYGFMM